MSNNKTEALVKLDSCQQAVIAALKAAGVESVSLRYHGSIEDGNIIDALEVTPSHLRPALHRTHVLVDESSYVLKDAILEVHDLALSASGYENYHEVGGEGWLVIDVLPDHGVPAGLTLQHSALESVRKPLFQMRNK